MSLTIPGKVFLIGEYAVLAGLPAWITAVAPRFSYAPENGKGIPLSPESPAGKLIGSLAPNIPAGKWEGNFIDPWRGLGGFGRSTAEFACVAYAAGMRDPIDVWNKYRDLTAGDAASFPPSGADLVAQWSGGTIEWDPEAKRITDLTAAVSRLPLLVFSATHLENRKTLTHVHLETLSVARDRESFVAELRKVLSPSLQRAGAGLREGNAFEIGKAFSDFASALSSLGLEAGIVKPEREALTRIPGVLGAKGCGALGTDAMLVMVDSLENHRRVDAIIEYAEREFGLKLLARGLVPERGIG